MKATVSASVLRDTTKCHHNFSCLDAGHCGEWQRCAVDYANGLNVLFLQTEEPALCPYRLSFGGCQTCTCPTHYALHATLCRK